jgi:hypothetical protein
VYHGAPALASRPAAILRVGKVFVFTQPPMRKVELVFPLLKGLVTQPASILKSVYHAVREHHLKQLVTKKHGLTNGLPEIDLAELVPDFHESVVSFTHLYGTSRPIDIALLRALAQRFERCRYLEIGSWRGESLANVSPLCHECVSVSLSGEQMKQRGFPERFILVEKIFSRDLPNVKHYGADSREFDFAQLGKFDLIFVDGDHRFEGVKNDTQKVFDLLRDENSIIVWHDYSEHFELLNWEVFAGIVDGAPREALGDIYHVTNTLCAIYLRNAPSPRAREFPAMPNKVFDMEIKMQARR